MKDPITLMQIMCQATIRQENLLLHRGHFIQQETTFGVCVGRVTRERLLCSPDAMRRVEKNG
jgi:hypothetical protein